MGTKPNFELDFVCDPAGPQNTFTCKDDYLTRHYQPTIFLNHLMKIRVILRCEAGLFRLAQGI